MPIWPVRYMPHAHSCNVYDMLVLLVCVVQRTVLLYVKISIIRYSHLLEEHRLFLDPLQFGYIASGCYHTAVLVSWCVI